MNINKTILITALILGWAITLIAYMSCLIDTQNAYIKYINELNNDITELIHIKLDVNNKINYILYGDKNNGY